MGNWDLGLKPKEAEGYIFVCLSSLSPIQAFWYSEENVRLPTTLGR